MIKKNYWRDDLAILALFIGFFIAVCLLLPMLIILGVALYGFAKGFFGSLFKSFA